MTKCLVAYFSATGVTKKVGEDLAQVMGCDTYEIKPETPYTEADLNWMDKSSRSSIEMKDKNSRPPILGNNFSVSEYDVIFLGFPIWWYVAPTIINTFLEKHNFAYKKIVLFATSGGSKFGKAVENLRPSVSPSTVIIEGKIFNNNPSQEELKQWVRSIIL